MRFLAAVKTWTRVEWVLAGSLAALVLGAVIPWYTLPSATLAAFGSSLWLPTVMRLLPLAAGVVILQILLRKQANSSLRISLWCGLYIALLFPFLVATFSPTVNYLGAAFDLQRDSVAYHIETHFPEVQSQWKHSMNLDPFEEWRPYVADGFTRSQVDVFATLPRARPFLIEDSTFFQPASWDRVIMEGMNYMPGFFSSAGWGWPITVAALSTALFGLYLAEPSLLFSDWKRLWRWFIGGTTVVLLVILVPSVVTRQISIWQARGQHARASRMGHLLYTCHPGMAADLTLLTQLCRSDAALNKATPAQLEFARGVECWQRSQMDKARTHFEQALREQDELLTRGYLAATLLKLGVQHFEQDQPVAAESLFRQVRNVYPSHLQATYYSMIARAATADFAGSAEAATEILSLQPYFRIPVIAAMGQAHLHASWADFRAGRYDQAWTNYQKSVDRGAWE